MELKKDEKIAIAGAIKMLGGYKNQSISDDNAQKESWRGKPPIPIMPSVSDYEEYLKSLGKEGDLDDKELLEKLAGQVFSVIKNYPEIMRELKEKYFKTL